MAQTGKIFKLSLVSVTGFTLLVTGFGTLAQVWAQRQDSSEPKGVIELAPVEPKTGPTQKYVQPTGVIDIRKYPQRAVIIGEVIELSTFATYRDEDDWEDYVASARHRAEKGFPVAILEEDTGDVYIAYHKPTAPASPVEPAHEKLAPYMGMRIVAAGLKYRKDAVNIFRITVMSEYDF